MTTENEQAPKAVSLKDLSAQVGQLVRWADGSQQISSIVKVLSQEYWENRIPRSDKWEIGITFLDNSNTLISNTHKVLIDPNDPLFQDIISEKEAKDILKKLLV